VRNFTSTAFSAKTLRIEKIQFVTLYYTVVFKIPHILRSNLIHVMYNENTTQETS